MKLKVRKEMLGECCRFWCSGRGGGGESGEETHTQLMPVLTSSPSVGQPQKSNIYNNLNVTTTEVITQLTRPTTPTPAWTGTRKIVLVKPFRTRKTIW